MKKGNIISGILIIITSLFFFFNTIGFKKLQSQVIGADFMPRLYASLLIILSVILIIQAYKKVEGEKENNEQGEVEKNYFKYSIFTMLFLLAYIVLIPIIGFYVSTIIFILLMLSFLQVRNKLVLVLVPIGTSVFIYAFFNILLNVSMPGGLIF